MFHVVFFIYSHIRNSKFQYDKQNKYLDLLKIVVKKKGYWNCLRIVIFVTIYMCLGKSLLKKSAGATDRTYCVRLDRRTKTQQTTPNRIWSRPQEKRTHFQPPSNWKNIKNMWLFMPRAGNESKPAPHFELFLKDKNIYKWIFGSTKFYFMSQNLFWRLK